MKRFTIILAFTAVLLLAAALPEGNTSSHPFIGNWTAIDTFDGSKLTFWIVEEARSGGRFSSSVDTTIELASGVVDPPT